MNIEIASGAVTAMLDHARRDHPLEACGILFGARTATASQAATIASAMPARNLAAHPETSFEIDPAALLRAHRAAREQGGVVAGWYHSHPNGVGQPSATDAARAVEDGKLWLIVAANVVSAWQVEAGGPVHGRFAAVPLSVA